MKEVEDCKIVVGERVAQQHCMVLCKLLMWAVKKKREVVETEGVSLPGEVQKGGEKGPTGSCRVTGGLGNHSWNA